MNLLSNQVRKARLNPKHPQFEKYQALYASQGNKPIVLEAGEKKILGQRLDIAPSFIDPLIAEMNRQYQAGAIQHSQLVPSIVPIQLVQLGELTIVCCAGEITTVAGQRLKQTVAKALTAQSEKTWLISYCNDYMGYVTTNEEYQLQAYEGGHTLFGQWTLAALQTRFSTLAQQIRLEKVDRKYDQNLRPLIPPKHELAKRTNNIYSQ
jgi:neutral ceramidase